ncbi:MAG: hypothetical protein WC814_01240 [Candidatus Paceibacterota bacterium]|jgi:hypothetical protein
MKTILDHIERVQGKPHHVRKRIAFASAALGTAFIALVWLAGSIGTGTFAIRDNSFASAGQEGTTPEAGPVVNGMAGAAAALPAQSADDAPAYIEIIDASAPAVPQKQAERTTIPF